MVGPGQIDFSIVACLSHKRKAPSSRPTLICHAAHLPLNIDFSKTLIIPDYVTIYACLCQCMTRPPILSITK